MADDKEVKDKDEKEEVSEVKKETIREVVEEAHKEEAKEETPQEEEETPQKEVPTPQKEEKPVEVPLEEVTSEVEKKAKEDVKQEVLKALGVSAQEKEQAEEAGWQSAWEKRGESKPASWKEAIEAGADLSDFRRDKADQLKEAEQEKIDTARQAQMKKLNTYWDGQLDDLRGQGKLPAIAEDVRTKMDSGEALSEEDREDPGVKAQKQLVDTMYDVGKQLESQGKPVVYNLKEIYYEFYEKKAAENQPAGADAPVSGGTSAVSTGGDETIDYTKDIVGKSFQDIIEESK